MPGQYHSIRRNILSLGGKLLMLSAVDTYRVIVATKGMVHNHLPGIAKAKTKKMTRKRPLHTRVVKEVVQRDKRRGGRTSTRDLMGTVCISMVEVVKQERLLRRKPDYKRLYRTTSLWRITTIKAIEKIMERVKLGEAHGLRGFMLVFDRIVH